MGLAPSGIGGENPSPPTRYNSGGGGIYRRTSKKKCSCKDSQFNADVAQLVRALDL